MRACDLCFGAQRRATLPKDHKGQFDTLGLTAVVWKRRASQIAEQAARVSESTTPIRTIDNCVAYWRISHKPRRDVKEQVNGNHGKTVRWIRDV